LVEEVAGVLLVEVVAGVLPVEEVAGVLAGRGGRSATVTRPGDGDFRPLVR
jgi:hypothetical protein